ncbi:nitroreductase family protein [Humidisolicoccus flavus]|uniref:nitroreductase family protein n=1 Tax=Humidisolicoccus flavus TaxID=3111414 RepID=UPI003254339F
MTNSVKTASTVYPVLDVLRERWSTRAFTETPIDRRALATALEAATWSPSAFNAQPWRFIVGFAGSEVFDRIVDTLIPFNQNWAKGASALMLTVAQLRDADGREQKTALYDLGQAMGHFAVQASAEGFHFRQMSGLSPTRAAEAFGLSDDYRVVSAVAIGYLGEPELLDEDLREAETTPRERKPLSEVLIEDDGLLDAIQ